MFFYADSNVRCDSLRLAFEVQHHIVGIIPDSDF